MKHIGRNILKLRTLKGIKQDVLARSVGLKQQELSRIENSENVKEDILELIAKELGFEKDVIKNFEEGAFVNSLYQHGGNVINYEFNSTEKRIELYEKRILEIQLRLNEKDELIKILKHEK